MIAQKERTAPQHTRFILPPIHPTKSSLRCVGGIFLFRGRLHLENFMSRPDVIPTFRHRRCKTGAGTAFGANGDQHTRAAELSTYFCALTIRKHLLKMRFERSGRGQEPSRGHKFSILENFLPIRDFTPQTLASFRSALVGACLPQTLPDKSKGALSAPMLFLSLLLFQFKLTLLFCFALFTAKCFSH